MVCEGCVEAARALTPPSSEPWWWGRSWAAFPYQPPVRGLIHVAKFEASRSAARVLAFLAAERIVAQAPPVPDAVVAVPLGRRRRRARGFNQVTPIAVALAELLGVPLLEPLVRVRETAPQAERGPDERCSNVACAFTCSAPVPRRVCLVDDVLTTGATLGAAAAALQQAGATRIEAVAAARARPRGA